MITNDIVIHYLDRITKVRIQYTSLKILRLIIGYNKCTWSPTISLSIILSKSPIIIFSSNYLFRLIFYVIFEKVPSIILPKALKMLESPMIALLTNKFFIAGKVYIPRKASNAQDVEQILAVQTKRDHRWVQPKGLLQ